MIRFLGFLVVLALGLALAALWQGQMHHLRQAAPAALPDWTSAMSSEAGFRQGRAVVPARGRVPGLQVDWAAKAPTGEGLLWNIRVQGTGIDLTAEVLLPWWPSEAILRGGDGAVDLAVLSEGAVQGLVGLNAVEGAVSVPDGTPVFHGKITAEARSVTAQGVELGGGPVTGTLAAGGDWTVKTALSGGISEVTGVVDGTLGASLATLAVTLADAAALPGDLAESLAAFGRVEGDGLVLTLPIPLR